MGPTLSACITRRGTGMMDLTLNSSVIRRRHCSAHLTLRQVPALSDPIASHYPRIPREATPTFQREVWSKDSRGGGEMIECSVGKSGDVDSARAKVMSSTPSRGIDAGSVRPVE
jgi:hypothetical protein